MPTSIIIDDENVFDNLDYGYYDNATIPYIPYIPDPRFLPCNLVPLDPTAALALCVILIGIFLLAIPGNLLVGWVMIANLRTLTPSDVYLCNLTLADGLLALTLPFWATTLTHGWIFGGFLCKVINLLSEANFYTSILFLVCISVDRYLMIVRAAETHSERQLFSFLVCAAMWAVGCALALPALFYEVEKSADGRLKCTEKFDHGSATSWRGATRALRHILGFFLPMVVMVTCYGVTIARLLRTRGSEKYRAMRLIVAVVIAFLLCWLPYHLTVIIDSLMRADLITFTCNMRKSVSVALYATHCVALLHSCINPFLYAFVGEKFKKKLRMLFQRRFRQERMSGSRFSRSTSQTSEGPGTFL